METGMRNLPIGIQSFENLRENGYLYVDKTDLVYKLVTTGKPYFFSRPRRFGKSLLISTLEAYFQGRKDLFHGLAIEGMEKEWKQYPVFHLDLNAEKYDAPERLYAILNNYLCNWEKAYGRDESETTLSLRFLGVIRRAYEQTGMGVALSLIHISEPTRP